MKKKLIIVSVALVLVVCFAVGMTIAYLTSTPGPVTNTFTVGKVEITLDETDVDEYGVQDGDTRVKENTYLLIPGHNYTKDPIVHVQPGSEACYVFVKVEDGLAAIEADTTIAAQIAANGWAAVDGATGVYYKTQAKVTGSNAVDLTVFSSFTLKTDADVTGYADAQIKITAYAIQQDGLTVAQAWAALNPTNP